MKKALNIFATMIAVILLCGVTVSCSKSDNEEPEQSATQTIIIFQPYANGLTNDLSGDLTEIKTAIKNVGTMSGYKLFVYVGENASRAYLYEIKYTNGSIVNDTIQKYTGVEQNDESYLTNIFLKIKETSPTSTYKLISGSHGSGWLPSTVRYDLIPYYSRSIGSYESSTVAIDITKFSKALTNANIHPDYILLDNCLMSNIESCWDLKSNTDYIISTPAEQPGYGYPYTEIWSDIIAPTSTDHFKNICQEFSDYYAQSANYNGYKDIDGKYVSPATISVIRCAALDQVASNMKAINQTYSEITEDNLSTVQRYDRKDPGIFYDLMSYIAVRIGDGYATNPYYQVMETAINDLVPIKMNNGYYLAQGKYCYPITSYSGISTSEPSFNTTIKSAKESTNFWTATH